MLRPEAIRVSSNYVRMILSFLAGIFVLRIALYLGTDLFAVYMILTIGFGIQPMLEQMLRMSLQPYLGFAYESRKDGLSFVFSNLIGVVAVFFLVGVAVLIFAGFQIDRFLSPKINSEVIWVMVLSRIISLAAFLIYLPYSCAVLVRGRYAFNNFVLMLSRVGDVFAFGIPFFLWGYKGAQLFIAVAVFAPMFQGLILCLGALIAHKVQTEFSFERRQISKEEIWRLIKEMRHAVIVVLSMNSYSRFALIFVSMTFGAMGVQVFSIAIQLAGYFRQVMDGLVRGLDAAFNKLIRENSTQLSTKNAKSLMRFSTGIQASISFNLFVVVLMFCDPLIELILSARHSLDSDTMGMIGDVALALMIGVVARNLTDTWRNMLIGNGNIKSLAKAVFPGAIVFIASLGGLLFGGISWDIELLGVAAGTGFVLWMIHLPLMLLYTKNEFSLRVIDLLGPAIRPGIIALIFFCLLQSFKSSVGLETITFLISTFILLSAVVFSLMFKSLLEFRRSL